MYLKPYKTDHYEIASLLTKTLISDKDHDPSTTLRKTNVKKKIRMNLRFRFTESVLSAFNFRKTYLKI